MIRVLVFFFLLIESNIGIIIPIPTDKYKFLSCRWQETGKQQCGLTSSSFYTCVHTKWVLQKCPKNTSCQVHPRSSNRILCNFDRRSCNKSNQGKQLCGFRPSVYRTCDNGRQIIGRCPSGLKCTQMSPNKIKCDYPGTKQTTAEPLKTTNKPETTTKKPETTTDKPEMTTDENKINDNINIAFWTRVERFFDLKK